MSLFNSDPTYFTLTRIHQNVYGDVNLGMQNLDTLVKHLKRYYQVGVKKYGLRN